MRSVVYALAFAALGSLSAIAQAKVAIVDFQKAVLGTAEIKKAQADLEVRFKPQQDKLRALEAELQKLQSELQTMQGKLTPQAENEKKILGQRKEREYQRVGEDLQAEVDRERNEILQRAGRQLREVVSKVAGEKGLDVVIDSNNTLFYKDVLDITNDVVAAYDKTYPAAK